MNRLIVCSQIKLHSLPDTVAGSLKIQFDCEAERKEEVRERKKTKVK